MPERRGELGRHVGERLVADQSVFAQPIGSLHALVDVALEPAIDLLVPPVQQHRDRLAKLALDLRDEVGQDNE